MNDKYKFYEKKHYILFDTYKSLLNENIVRLVKLNNVAFNPNDVYEKKFKYENSLTLTLIKFIKWDYKKINYTCCNPENTIIENVIIFEDLIDLSKLREIDSESYLYLGKKFYLKDLSKVRKCKKNLYFKKLSQEIIINKISDKFIYIDNDTKKEYTYYVAVIEIPKNYLIHKSIKDTNIIYK